MQAVKIHSHYDPTGTVQLLHRPGDVYELHDGGGMTADQLANSFIAMGFAKLADPGAVVDDDPEPAPIGELPKNLPPKKPKSKAGA